MVVKKKFKGAILLEAALGLLLNTALILGGLETGYYLYVNQALSGAAAEACRFDSNGHNQRIITAYLIGLGFPDPFIESVSIASGTSVLADGSTARSVTLTIPTSVALLFLGGPSKLVNTDQTSLSFTSYFRNDNKK